MTARPARGRTKEGTPKMPDLSFKINADTSGLKKGLEDARGQINRALGSIGGIGGLLTAGGAVAGIEKAVSSHVERAKDIAKLAQLANSSIAEASKLLTTGASFGVTSDKLADALRNVAQADALAQHLTGTLIPVLGNVAEAAFSAWDMLSQLATTRHQFGSITEEDSKIPIAGGVANVIAGSMDILLGNKTEALKQVNERV